MDKRFFKSSALAALVIGALCMGGCTADDPDNGQQGSTPGEVVKTQFAISIGSGSQSTRQSAATVQANDQAFRGMTDIHLVTLKFGTLPTAAWASIDLADRTDCYSTQFGPIEAGTITTSASSKIYSDINIPVHTNGFLFYAKAKADDDIANKVNGKVNYTIGATGDIKFEKVVIKTGEELSVTTEAVAMLKALSAIYGVVLDNTQTGYDADLANTIKTQVNGGSSAAMLESVKSLLDATTGDLHDAIADLFTSRDDVKAVFGNYATDVALQTGYTNFPAQYDMPDGAALISYDNDDKVFKWITAGKIGDVASLTYTPVDNITYPAELMYYCASPVLATDKALTNAQWTKGTPAEWKGTPSSSVTTEEWYNAVKTSTKSVALVNNVNYGVAQLQTKVKVADDNLDAFRTGVVTSKVSKDNFKLTGILVGGQSNEAGFNFLPNETKETDMVGAVYDVLETPAALATDPATQLYTLVFDNYVKDGNEGKKVIFALEFVYEGQDFNGDTKLDPIKGQDGMIYPGMKFYLVGSLNATTTDPNTTGSKIAWDSLQLDNQPIYFPAYNTDRVFVQDFTTTASVTVNSLKNAYVGIPDLRSAQVSFGLSVDIEWKAGLEFNVDID